MGVFLKAKSCCFSKFDQIIVKSNRTKQLPGCYLQIWTDLLDEYIFNAHIFLKGSPGRAPQAILNITVHRVNLTL